MNDRENSEMDCARIQPFGHRKVVSGSTISTSLAPILGPHLTGLLAPFPLYATILAAFAHHLQGPAAAIGVLRGLLVGLFAFASFFLVLAILIEQIGIAPTFAAAILVAVVLQGMSLWVLRYMPR